jgi:hypothetical protein
MLDVANIWESTLLTLDESLVNELERSSVSLGIRYQQLLLSAVKLLGDVTAGEVIRKD